MSNKRQDDFCGAQFFLLSDRCNVVRAADIERNMSESPSACPRCESVAHLGCKQMLCFENACIGATLPLEILRARPMSLLQVRRLAKESGVVGVFFMQWPTKTLNFY